MTPSTTTGDFARPPRIAISAKRHLRAGLHRRRHTPTVNTPATRTATVSTRSTSIPSKASGRCCARGYGPIAVFRRRNCRAISPFSSSSTTRENAAKRCCQPSSRPSSPPRSDAFDESNVPNFHNSAERPAVTPKPDMSDEEYAPKPLPEGTQSYRNWASVIPFIPRLVRAS